MALRLGITMGDPRGIGPEIIRAAVTHLTHRNPGVTWVLYGLPDLFRSLNVELEEATGPRAAREAIERAAEDLNAGSLDAVITGPVSKACFEGDFPGHTELFAARLGAPRYAMLMAGRELSVVPLTTHVALRDVAGLLRQEEIVATGSLVHKSLCDAFGLTTPRLALAGLNPHAGDGGLFGDEEARIMTPAIAELRQRGVNIEGPCSPDTVYFHARQGRYDVVLCPYHDQGLVPFKLIHFSDGVNCTLGLPRPRTSPDHGPAYDIAGKGVADPTSMIRAIEMAARLARQPLSDDRTA